LDVQCTMKARLCLGAGPLVQLSVIVVVDGVGQVCKLCCT
jgi:hypothetical protein